MSSQSRRVTIFQKQPSYGNFRIFSNYFTPQIRIAILLENSAKKSWGVLQFSATVKELKLSVTYPCDFSTCSLISLGNVASSIRRLYSFWATPDIPGTRFCCKYLLARSATADIHYRMYSLSSRIIFWSKLMQSGRVGVGQERRDRKLPPPRFRINERISLLCFYTVIPHSLQSRHLANVGCKANGTWCVLCKLKKPFKGRLPRRERFQEVSKNINILPNVIW